MSTDMRPRRSWTILALALTAGAILVAGCSSSGTTAQGGEDVVRMVDTITVSGSETIKAGPDEAIITVMVETDGTDAGQALEANSSSMNSVLQKLKEAGVADDSIQTSNVAVFPNRRYDPQTGKETVESYRAQNSVRVTLTDLAQVGPVFAVAVEAGAGSVSGPEWRLSDDGEAVARALDGAYASARAKAEALAAASGVKLGDVITVVESGVTQPPIVFEEFARAGADMAVPVNPMDLEITGSVTVTFRLSR